MDAREVDLFLGLPKGSFDHIPSYCRAEALDAIRNVRELEERNLFHRGVHYVALMDLSDSTKNAEPLGQKLHEKRVQSFVTGAVAALGQFRPQSYSHFLKQTGDAVLMIFSCFDDLYSWWKQSEENFLFHSGEANRELEPKISTLFRIRAKTVVHLGEISYQKRKNPISVAAKQMFTTRKKINPPHFEPARPRGWKTKPIFLLRPRRRARSSRAHYQKPKKKPTTTAWPADKKQKTGCAPSPPPRVFSVRVGHVLLTRSFPLASPFGLPVYVARLPAAPFSARVGDAKTKRPARFHMPGA